MAIETEAAAQRLVRAMLTDMARYNRTKLSTGGIPQIALATDLVEARALFHERVAPALHSLFDRELNAFDFSGAAAPAAARIPAVVALGVVLAIALAGAAYLLVSR